MARAIERGESFLAEEDYDKARIEFSNALQIDPNNPEVIYLAGRSAEGLQDYRTAAQAYRASLENDPTYLPAMAATPAGMVAEKSSFWAVSGTFFRMRRTSGKKPMSHMRSASSRTSTFGS